jgi:hypothetical protein
MRAGGMKKKSEKIQVKMHTVSPIDMEQEATRFRIKIK